MLLRTLRTAGSPEAPHESSRWLRAFAALACLCLFFSASLAEGKRAAGKASPGAHARAGGWKVHSVRSNRPSFRKSGEILVEYAEGANRSVLKAPRLASKIRSARASSGRRETLIFDEGATDFATMREQLLATPGILRAEPNLVLSTQSGGRPLDGVNYFEKQWHLKATRGQQRLLRSSRKRAPARQAARIGVIDTGIDYRHREFAGRTLKGVNLISNPLPGESAESETDFNGHGTRVAGIIAAADDQRGVLGLNPRARICSIKAFNRDGDGYLEDIIAGIDWAIANEMHVINMSFGMYEYSDLLQEAVARAHGAGILMVAAAGNDAAQAAMYPAAFREVVSVGAHHEGGWTSLYSNWGSSVDFHAPGDQILTTDLWLDGSDPYAVFHGTSAAAAYTSGVASLLIEDGESASTATDILRENVIERSSDYRLRSANDLWLNGRLIMARLLGEPYAALSIVDFDPDRSVFAPEDYAHFSYRIQNSGMEPSVATQAWLDVREGEEARRVALDDVPPLAPGEHYETSVRIAAPELLGGGSDSRAQRVRVGLALGGYPAAASGPRQLLISEAPVDAVRVRALWVSPLDFNDANPERTLYATVENAGRDVEAGLTARVFAVAAVHEGVSRAPKIDLGTLTVGSLAPGEVTQLSLPLTHFEPPRRQVTFWLEIEQGGERLTRYLQGYRYSDGRGTATPEYAGAVHRTIADEAVALLEAQGIYIADLHAPGSIYRGDPTVFNEWPRLLGLPTAAWQVEGFWTDAELAGGAATFGLNGFTLVDGAHDSDGVDIAFGYSFEDNFDSHFWIVDSFDDDGLDSLGTNHHSALSKLRALIHGTGPGPLADSQLDYGAIDHYLNGHKQAAWWFIGHAIHLIGDISVPSHVDNENTHGAQGATFHGWMDQGNNTRWDHTDALSRGGFIPPFTPANEGDPLRYLLYTTAQLGNAFPWAETIGTQGGFDGNRTAGGDPPHYDATMQSLFATLAPRPLYKWHVNKDEVWDTFANECQLVDFIILETRQDCWDQDGHIDYDNTDDGGSDNDGDMVRIGTENYPYAIRAAAGLIYYFALQTGQIDPTDIPTMGTGGYALLALSLVATGGRACRVKRRRRGSSKHPVDS